MPRLAAAKICAKISGEISVEVIAMPIELTRQELFKKIWAQPMTDVLAPPDTSSGGGVLQAPRGGDFYEWMESISDPIPEDER